MFKHIELLTMRAFYRAKEDGMLPPFLGSTIRGILGHCMRDFSCIVPDEKCHLCMYVSNCDYAQNFCSPGNVAGSVNPFVIYIPLPGKTKWREGDTLIFDLTLIGKAVNAAGLFLDGLQAMADRGWGARRMKFQLEQVINPRTGHLIWDNGKTWLRNIRPEPLETFERQASSVLIRFDSPTRVLVGKQMCHELTFSNIIQAICRRIALLSHAYADIPIEWDEEALLEDASKIKTVEQHWKNIDFSRYSMNHKGKLELPAIEGWARFEGDLEPFTSILEAGHRLHIGKNATHGFGHFNLFYDR